MLMIDLHLFALNCNESFRIVVDEKEKIILAILDNLMYSCGREYVYTCFSVYLCT